MSDSIFSSSWYRVAELKPRLRPHARLHRHVYRDAVWYILEDQSSGRSHRFNIPAYNCIGLFDGQRSVAQIWDQVTERFGDEAPTQEEFVQLLGNLHSIDLLQCDVPPDIDELLERHKNEIKKDSRGRFGNPLSIRISILDPEKFLCKTLPWVRPLFTTYAAIFWIAIVSFAILLTLKNWSEITNYASANALTASNLFIIWLIYPIIKGIHELGHAYAIKIRGGEVHELGLMFLIFTPVPYVDASAASAFPNKFHRMLVGAIGILVELFLAALCVIVWVNIEDGLIRSLAFNVMLIGGVSTVLFNGNPLLRFDGYHVLADWTEIPRLAQRSIKYYGYLIQRYLFSVQDLHSPVQASGEARWFLFYGVAAFAYRIFVMISIVLLVAGKWFFVGVGLAIWALTVQAGLPLYRWCKFLLSSPILQRKRTRALSSTLGILSSSIAIIFLVPLPLATQAQGVVWLPEKSQIRANSEAFVAKVLKPDGSEVAPKEALLEMRDPFLESEVKIQQAKLKELEMRYFALRHQDPAQAKILQQEIAALAGEVERSQERLDELIVTSPTTGVFVVPDGKNLPGKFVRQGEPLGYVIDTQRLTVRAVVPQTDIGLVRQRTHYVSLRFIDIPHQEYASQIEREIPAASTQLPSKALSRAGGGLLETDPFDTEGMRTQEKHFQLDLKLPENLNFHYFGQRTFIRFDHGFEPIVWRWYRGLKQLFLRQFGI